jgi:hypothetical protein
MRAIQIFEASALGLFVKMKIKHLQNLLGKSLLTVNIKDVMFCLDMFLRYKLDIQIF